VAGKISEIKGVKEVYVKIVSQIGRPINDPHMANVQLLLEDGVEMTSNMRAEISSLLQSDLDSIDKVTEMILQRKASLY